MKKRLQLGLAFILTASSLYAKPPETISVPISFDGQGRIFVDAKINGRDVRAMIDSGAQSSVISCVESSCAIEKNNPRATKALFSGVDKSVETAISFPSAICISTACSTTDVLYVQGALRESIISAEFLRSTFREVTIDYEHKKLILTLK